MKVKSILVSQPEPANGASPYLELEKKTNVKVDFRPFIHVEGMSAREIRNQKIDLAQFSGVIFTSRNAVDHYFRLAEDMRFQVPDAMKYFCLSEAIAYYLQKYIVYRKRKVFIGDKTPNGLIPYMEKNKSLKYLLPSSDILNKSLPRVLNKLKIKWERVMMYKTVCSDLSDLKEVKYDVLVFFSPYGIKSLFENFPDFKQDATKIAVYGKTTVAEAKEKGLKIDIEVPTKEIPSMSIALEKYIKAANKK